MNVDVMIVGAGPTGLMLAGDLAEAGVSVGVLERRPAGVSNISRAFGVHARTLELLDMRGLADELVATGAHVQRLRLFDRVRLDLGRLPTRFNYLLITPQYETERVLHERLHQLGVTITHEAEVVDLAQDETGVDVTVRRGSSTQQHRATYLVGTDGVGSIVRARLGLPFPGESALRSIMLADVRLANPPSEVLTVNGVGDAFAFIAPFGDGWFRIFAWDRRNAVADDAPLELDEVRDTTLRALGSDFGMHDPRWLSRFHSDERQVPQYRVGRVFLAGDAAHVHSPAGGQGMNTGMQDAANLGWKLAAVLHGHLPASLLDSYHAERHPVGRTVLRTSGRLIRAAMIRPRIGRLLRNTLAGLALRVPALATRATGTISGIGTRYAAPEGADPLVGTRVGDITLTDGRLYERLRGHHFVLVAPEAPADLPPWVEHSVPADSAQPPLLIRPDGYVAWAGELSQFRTWIRARVDGTDQTEAGTRGATPRAQTMR